jgi:phytoene desaturase
MTKRLPPGPLVTTWPCLTEAMYLVAEAGGSFGAAHGFFQVGPFRPANYSRKIDGPYYAGASTTPGRGLPMVLLSGRLAAERVVEREGRRGA